MEGWREEEWREGRKGGRREGWKKGEIIIIIIVIVS